MRFLFLAVTLSMIAAPVFAEDVTGPKEVGTTTMPAGQYYVTEQISKKSYSLTVTDKGSMILGPAPAGVSVAVTDTNAAGTSTATTATAAASEASGNAATNAVNSAAGQAAGFIPSLKNPAMDGLMRQGIQQGTQQMNKMLTK